MNTLRLTVLVCSLALALTACGGGGSGGSSSGGGTVSGSRVSLDQAASGDSIVSVDFSTALGINDQGKVIGFAEITPGIFSAASWEVSYTGTPSAAPLSLLPLSGTYSAAFAIDEAGNAVGQSENEADNLVGVIWRNGNPAAVALPVLTPGTNSAAYAISADGNLIAGEARDSTGRARAVLWVGLEGVFATPPLVLPFTVFDSGVEPSRFSSAYGVARVSGTEILVVGEAESGNGAINAALWRSTNNGASFTATNIGTGYVANGVNSAGRIVGEADGTSSPVTWTVAANGQVSAPVQLFARLRPARQLTKSRPK
jgi:hypothetical protein